MKHVLAVSAMLYRIRHHNISVPLLRNRNRKTKKEAWASRQPADSPQANSIPFRADGSQIHFPTFALTERRNILSRKFASVLYFLKRDVTPEADEWLLISLSSANVSPSLDDEFTTSHETGPVIPHSPAETP